MKVNYQNNRDINFKGFLDSKLLKKSLEFAAENGTLFAATTTLVLSGVRPIAILSTPNTDKKNKQVASAKSITSSINGYLISLFCSIPIAKAIKKIDKKPERFLDPKTIQNLKEGAKPLVESKAYSMATQMFKLGLGFIIAAPKAVLTAIGTPYILDLFFTQELNTKTNVSQNQQPSFKGKEKLPSGIGKIINNKKFQEFVKKYKDSNFPMHIIAATDTIATASFVHQTKVNKKLEEKDKKPLIYNSIIATLLSIISTYTIDKMTQKQTDKFIEKYKKINKNDKNVLKQIEGIKNAKPMLIAGSIYYILIPILSTYFADRIKFTKN